MSGRKSAIFAAVLICVLFCPTAGRAVDVTMYEGTGKSDIQLLAGFETESELAAWRTEGGATMTQTKEMPFEGRHSTEVFLPTPASRIALAAGPILPADISAATYFMFQVYSPAFVPKQIIMALEDEGGQRFSKTFELDPLGFLSACLRVEELAQQMDVTKVKQFSLSCPEGEKEVTVNFDNLVLFNRPEDRGVAGVITREKRGSFNVLTVDDGTKLPSITPEDEKRGYLAFTRHYLRRVYPSTVPGKRELLKAGDKLVLRASPGEYEPIALGIFPLRDIDGFSPSVTNLSGADGVISGRTDADVRLVDYACTGVGPKPLKQCLALPRDLHKKLWVKLRKHESRQYWITVHVPGEARPGIYTGEIILRGKKAPTLRIPLEVEVLPITLESPPGVDFVMVFEKAFRDIGWISDTTYTTSTEAIPEDVVALSKGRIIYQDLKAHGMTAVSPYCHDVYREKPNGEPYLPVAETSLEEAKRAGLMGPAVCVFTKLLKTEKLNRSSGTYAEYDSEVHPQQAKKIAEYLVRKAKENGWPQPVILPIDEPAHPDRNRIAVELTRAIKEVPGAMTSVCCTQYSGEKPFPWIDIPNYNTFLYDPEEIAKTKKAGKKAWFYNNSAITRVNAAKSRFVYGLFGWRSGADGITSWTYHLNIYSAFRTDVFGNRRPNWDPETGTPVPCREWEAIREGIDDRRYIYALEKLIDEARRQKQIEAAASAQNLLDELWARIDPNLRNYNFTDIITGEMHYENFLQPEEFDHYRQRIIEEILKLKEII